MIEESYKVVNVKEYIDKNKSTYVEEQELHELLSSFSCPLNTDVEDFLRNNAIDFTKKDQSITYLVFNDENDLVGYFSLASKPISVMVDSVSKSMAKKLSRVSVLNKENNTYTASAYLIAQLGKNFALPEDERIDGATLLEFALETVQTVKYFLGGVIVFLECEDVKALMDFYMRNGFKYFASRITSGENPRILNQLLKLI